MTVHGKWLTNPHAGLGTNGLSRCQICSTEWKAHTETWIHDIEAGEIHDGGRTLCKKQLERVLRKIARENGLEVDLVPSWASRFLSMIFEFFMIMDMIILLPVFAWMAFWERAFSSTF